MGEVGSSTAVDHTAVETSCRTVDVVMIYAPFTSLFCNRGVQDEPPDILMFCDSRCFVYNMPLLPFLSQIDHTKYITVL